MNPTALASTLDKILHRRVRLGFVGLGYVGLPVSLSFASAGFEVRGFDIDESRINAVQAGLLPFAKSEPGLAQLLTDVIKTGRLTTSHEASVLDGCDFQFLAIDTPIDEDKRLDRERLEAGLAAIARYLRVGDTLVIESTIAPGTIDDFVIPTIRRISGLTIGVDISLIHCPERLRPGRLLKNLVNLPRFVGADSPPAAEAATALYATVVHAELHATHYRTAEVIKTAENAARDVQIALANQLAIVCDLAGVSFDAVRGAVNDLWSREPLVLQAGPGVGGHCLPKDPWLMVAQLGDPAMRSLVSGARAMNGYMPRHVVAVILRLIRQRPDISNATVTLLGVSYNADSDDTRNSPTFDVAALLAPLGIRVRLHDPLVAGFDGPLAEVLAGAHVCVLMVAHHVYLNLLSAEVASTMATPIILDTRRALNQDAAESLGFRYAAVGRSALYDQDDL